MNIKKEIADLKASQKSATPFTWYSYAREIDQAEDRLKGTQVP